MELLFAICGVCTTMSLVAGAEKLFSWFVDRNVRYANKIRLKRKAKYAEPKRKTDWRDFAA